MPEREITCCFTGHRPAKLPWGTDESDPRCIELKKQLSDKLEQIYALGYRHFICGMAVGCDFYFYDAVLELRHKYGDVTAEAAIPCDTQSSSWNADEKERYGDFITASDIVTHVGHLYHRGCMMQRNKYMVDNSSLILACYNGTKGGTMSTLLYAGRCGLQEIIIELD